MAAVQNTVAKENVGAFGVFTRFGRTIGLFGTAWNVSIETSRDMDSDTRQLPWVGAFSLSARRRRTSERRTILSTTPSAAHALAPWSVLLVRTTFNEAVTHTDCTQSGPCRRCWAVPLRWVQAWPWSATQDTPCSSRLPTRRSRTALHTKKRPKLDIEDPSTRPSTNLAKEEVRSPTVLASPPLADWNA